MIPTRTHTVDSTQNPPVDGAEITIRGFCPVTSASVPAVSIGLNELVFGDGTVGQVLTTNGAGTLSFQTIPTQDPALGGALSGTASAAVINANTISVNELNVSDGLAGQVLATDGAGNLTFINPPSGGSGGGASSFFDLSGVIQLNQIGDETITNEKIGTYQLTPDRIATADSSVGSAGQILSVDGNGDFTWVSVVGSGEANTASNVGAGSGIFLQKSGVDLQFKTPFIFSILLEIIKNFPSPISLDIIGKFFLSSILVCNLVMKPSFSFSYLLKR